MARSCGDLCSTVETAAEIRIRIAAPCKRKQTSRRQPDGAAHRLLSPQVTVAGRIHLFPLRRIPRHTTWVLYLCVHWRVTWRRGDPGVGPPASPPVGRNRGWARHSWGTGSGRRLVLKLEAWTASLHIITCLLQCLRCSKGTFCFLSVRCSQWVCLSMTPTTLVTLKC